MESRRARQDHKRLVTEPAVVGRFSPMDSSANRQRNLPVVIGNPGGKPGEIFALFAGNDAIQAGVVTLAVTANTACHQRQKGNGNQASSTQSGNAAATI